MNYVKGKNETLTQPGGTSHYRKIMGETNASRGRVYVEAKQSVDSASNPKGRTLYCPDYHDDGLHAGNKRAR